LAALAVLVILALGVSSLINRPAPLSGPALRSALDGTWTGEYKCNQGVTGVTLSMTTTSNSTIKAEFNFYSVPANPGIPAGSGSMEGTFSSDQIYLHGTQWILRPDSTWRLIDMQAKLSAGRFTKIEGEIPVSGCSWWRVTKRS
jgi:hypothetical protein